MKSKKWFLKEIESLKEKLKKCERAENEEIMIKSGYSYSFSENFMTHESEVILSSSGILISISGMTDLVNHRAYDILKQVVKEKEAKK